MKISFLGGALEIGGSCILVQLDNKNILLDCGIRQSASKDPVPDFRIIQEQGGIDAAVISHAHMDHTGCLPIISKEYPDAKIYMSRMTKDLVKVLLYDSIKIMNCREAEIPLYNEEDVENMLKRVYPLNYEAGINIFDNIRVTLYNAGHIAGAACVYIEGSEGTIFYSGDFSLFSQRSIEGARIPKLRPDAAIFESTYGDKLHSNRDIEEQRLISTAEECIKKGGKMLIPAFALGRAQEVLLILKRAMNKGELSKVNIYADGMVRNINTVYKMNPLYLKGSLGKKILRGYEPFYDDNIKAIQKKEEREKILSDDKPCIIVSSSGMLTGGPSQEYAEKISGMENGYIVITGYQDEESPGRKLLNLLKENEEDRYLEINEKRVPVKCSIKQVGLSAHSDKSEIKALISHICHGNVFLVHGEETSINSLAKEVIREVRGSVYIPKCGESFDIHVKNPRHQWSKQFPYVMKKDEKADEKNIKELYDFARDKYGERLFTVEEMMYIWSGRSKSAEEDIEYFQKLILNTPYFENDERRLFLFKAESEENVNKKLNEGELNQTQIYDRACDYFNEYSYKKIGMKVNEKELLLYFDFPWAVESGINKKINEFEKETNWKVKINEQINSNAVDNLIRTLLKDADIKKISHYFNEKFVIAALNKPYDIKDEKEIFNKATGLELKISDTNGKDNTEDLKIICSDAADKMEQNEAIALIDKEFQHEEFRPYKKSIKVLNGIKYLELYFITTVIGFKYEENIKKLSKLTGWNMKVANSCNQNEIISMALRLCSTYEVKLKKNPSFNSSNLSVSLKVESGDEEKLQNIKKEFDYKTGCILIF